MAIKSTDKPAVKLTDISKKAAVIPQQATSLRITNQVTFEKAGEFLKVIKGLRAKVNAAFDPIIDKAHEAHKEALAQKRKAEAPLVEAEGIIKPRIAGYLQQKERERREEELRLRREAEERERIRLQAEKDAMIEELVEEDKFEEAAKIIDQEVVVEPASVHVYVPNNVEKVEGISVRKNYSAEVVDLMALVKAVAAGQVPVQALQANMVFLNQQARAYKEGLSYPGVRVVITGNVAARS